MGLVRFLARLVKNKHGKRRVWLYWPNLLGYARAALLLGGWVASCNKRPYRALTCFAANYLGDNLDGVLARRFKQTSSFGAFLDVLLDNSTRGLLWTLALPAGLGMPFVVLEMSVLCVTHQVSKAREDWKAKLAQDDAKDAPPPWVAWIMTNNFKTQQGSFVIVGLMGLPLWAWGQRFLPPDSMLRHWALGAILIPGRAMAAAVEFWVLLHHVRSLLQQDAAAAAATVAGGRTVPAPEQHRKN